MEVNKIQRFINPDFTTTDRTYFTMGTHLSCMPRF
jgi:hypothetical protein